MITINNKVVDLKNPSNKIEQDIASKVERIEKSGVKLEVLLNNSIGDISIPLTFKVFNKEEKRFDTYAIKNKEGKRLKDARIYIRRGESSAMVSSPEIIYFIYYVMGKNFIFKTKMIKPPKK